jgi:hypothetical protein
VKAAALAFLFIANLATASVELAGAFIASTDSRFLLTDNSTGATSEWLKIGDSFQGYLVVSFDAESEVLDLKSGTSTYHLRLRPAAKVQPPPAPLKHSAAYWTVQNLEHYFAKDNVLLIDTKLDGSFVIMTPREVWKGSDYPVGKPIRIPLEQFPYWGDKANFVAQPFVMALPAAETPFSFKACMVASVVDDLVGGRFPYDDFRVYMNANSVTPKPKTP